MIRINNLILDLNISGHRKLLHEAVEEHANLEREDAFDILDEIHEAISNQDEEKVMDTEYYELDLDMDVVEEDDILEQALKNAGYKVEKSNISSSIYAINDEGKEVRISDHERPAIVQGNVAVYEHEKGFIVKGIEVSSNALIRLGFSKLEKNKTFYLD